MINRPAMHTTLKRTRRLLGFLAFVLGAVVVSGCGGGSSSGGASTESVTAQFARLVNDYRAGIGCRSLAWDARLAKVAKAHSDDMSARKYVSHVNPDGAGIKDRLNAAGYSSGGENIAAGYGSAELVLEAWLQSPTHRSNLDNCSWAHHGAGLSSAGKVWTHLLAK